MNLLRKITQVPPEIPKPPLVAIVGPTASGKSELAVDLCRVIGGAVISADSRQVYRGMDIGTAKPSVQERRGIDHRLLDIRPIDRPYSLSGFLRDANGAIADVRGAGLAPVVVGGTALYVHALLSGFAPGPSDPALRAHLEQELDRDGLSAMFSRLKASYPAAAGHIDSRNPRRVVRALERHILFDRGSRTDPWPEHEAVILGVCHRPDRRTAKIADRTRAMIENGLTDEARRLFGAHGRAPVLMSTIGYPECHDYLVGRCDLAATEGRIRTATNQYARRQMTYLRNKMRIQWLDPDRPSMRQALALITRSG